MSQGWNEEHPHAYVPEEGRRRNLVFVDRTVPTRAGKEPAGSSMPSRFVQAETA